MTVYTITPDALVGDVATLMVTHGVGDVIVVEEGKPVGILTDRDLVARVMAAGLNGKSVLVRDIMSTPPVTVPQSEEVSTAIALMSHHGIRRLPIIDEAGTLVSILTLDDIIMLSLNGQPELSNIVRRQLGLGDAPHHCPQGCTLRKRRAQKDQLHFHYLARSRTSLVRQWWFRSLEAISGLSAILRGPGSPAIASGS